MNPPAPKRGPVSGPLMRENVIVSSAGRRVLNPDYQRSPNPNPPSSSSQPQHQRQLDADQVAASRSRLAAAHQYQQSQQHKKEPSAAELAGPSESRRQPKNGGRSLNSLHIEKIAERQKAPTEKASVADTLAWVRAKSFDRRSSRNNNPDPVPNDESPLPTAAAAAFAPKDYIASASLVEQSLARGQALLLSSEKNMSGFEDYMRSVSKDKDQTQSASSAASGGGGDFAAYVANAKSASASNQNVNSSNLVYQKLRPVQFDSVNPREAATGRSKQARDSDSAVPDVNTTRIGGRPCSQPNVIPIANTNADDGSDVVKGFSQMKITQTSAQLKSEPDYDDEDEEEDMVEIMRAIKDDSSRRFLLGSQIKEAQKMQAQSQSQGKADYLDYQKHLDSNFQLMIREGADEMKREGKRNEIIAEKKAKKGRGRPASGNSTSSITSVNTANFDPDQLQGVKRSALDVEKRAQAKAESDKKAADLRIFKALPLPGGVEVVNDLHKQTKSAELRNVKNVKSKHQVKGRESMRMEASDLFRKLDGRRQSQYVSSPTSSSSSSSSLLLVEDEDLQLKKISRKKFRSLAKAEKEQEGVLSLQQEIDGLERRLRKGKYKHEHDDGGEGEAMQAAQIRPKNTADFELEVSSDSSDVSSDSDSGSDDESDSSAEAEVKVLPIKKKTNKTTKISKKHAAEDAKASAVYRRQNLWLADKEAKRRAAQEEKEERALDEFTGKPETAFAKDSWEKAKLSHQRATEKAKMEEDYKLAVRVEKEEAEERRNLREIALLRRNARAKKRVRLAKVHKGRQEESLEKLSKPKNSNSNLRSAAAESEVADAESVQSNVNEGGDDGFGDMDEKQYIKVMKALGLDPGISAIKKKEKTSADDAKKKTAKKTVERPPRASTSAVAASASSSSAVVRKITAEKVDSGDARDWRRADFVHDTSVMKEIDDVFAELESEKWGEKEKKKASDSGVNASVGEDIDVDVVDGEDDSSYVDGGGGGGEEGYRFEESADDASVSNSNSREDNDNDNGNDDEDEYNEESIDFTPYIEDQEDPAPPAKYWNFKGHSNNEGIMAHASSALEAAEMALSGLINGEMKNNSNSSGGGSGKKGKTSTKSVQALFDDAIDVKLQPYEKFERGHMVFFDKSSSAEKGRFRVRDARDFKPESMRRKEEGGSEGVMLLVGTRTKTQTHNDEDDEEEEFEQAITILFDKVMFTEGAAIEWWGENRHKFLGEGKFGSGGSMPPL